MDTSVTSLGLNRLWLDINFVIYVLNGKKSAEGLVLSWYSNSLNCCMKS